MYAIRSYYVPKIGLIAGCYVKTGKVRRNESAHVIRDGVILHSGKITSLKRFKDDAREVDAGYECGIGIENYLDVQVGDEFEVYVIKDVITSYSIHYTKLYEDRQLKRQCLKKSTTASFFIGSRFYCCFL